MTKHQIRRAKTLLPSQTCKSQNKIDSHNQSIVCKHDTGLPVRWQAPQTGQSWRKQHTVDVSTWYRWISSALVLARFIQTCVVAFNQFSSKAFFLLQSFFWQQEKHGLFCANAKFTPSAASCYLPFAPPSCPPLAPSCYPPFSQNVWFSLWSLYTPVAVVSILGWIGDFLVDASVSQSIWHFD